MRKQQPASQSAQPMSLSCSSADVVAAGMQSDIGFQCIVHYFAGVCWDLSATTGAQSEQMSFGSFMLCSLTAAVYRTAIRPATKQQFTDAACPVQATPAQEAAGSVQSTQHESLPRQMRWSLRTQHM